ncbi:5-formyltetrahydrofolate cyclo-ligase [Dysgonomonas hofstadii]|uniref:5-formyltetrahydrofolate cyclo-ligase n=1 Tax=Dysgonomonas hofstadii TaxID=637886 RepID=A0A840CTF0_9BACT|nr:5-formyltetrahydrofolate cyclo-ligase [Dysgonomonas hofstadii]MBB4035802.1 5-formyltetrahydrofolate cyclo-ligase [Dysgonomonas hofstadii]
MNKVQQEKDKLRKKILTLKKGYTQDELYYKSLEVLSIVEITGIFQEAEKIFIYNNLKDEVHTLDFIRKWEQEKEFYLPVVDGDDLRFRRYSPSTGFQQSSYGIMEPIGEDFTDYNKVDLVIVPGMAFDRRMNRMGRGRGFYDRLLPKLKAPRMGVCFDFQLFDQIPIGEKDIKMDYIVSENDFMW